MADFECSHCGKCCLTIPCIFAQVKYRLNSKSKDRCPSLFKREDGKYSCSLIERDPEARRVLLSGDCDNPELSHLKKKFNAKDIVREYFPKISDDEIEYILFNETSYPDFWNIPEDGWTARQCLHTQLKRFVDIGRSRNSFEE
jgi:hypothetical protein